MGRRLGLIIGVNKYQDAAFRPLKFAETDARALAQWLVNAQGGKWSPADVQLVLGAQASSELVESLVTQVCVNVGSLARNVLGKSRASQILVILDCFQTGSVWNMRRSSLYDSKPVLGPRLLKALQQWKGRMFLCSC